MVSAFLDETREVCHPHKVFREGDVVVARSFVHDHKLSGNIYPYDDHVVLHCFNYLGTGRRLYLVADTQNPHQFDAMFELLLRHLNGEMMDHEYNGR